MNPLDIKFESTDLNKELTIREYLRELLHVLWIEGEEFRGKRPFGNSGWQYDVYIALIQHGYIEGKVDEYGDIEECDDDAGMKIVCRMIDEIFFPVTDNSRQYEIALYHQIERGKRNE